MKKISELIDEISFVLHDSTYLGATWNVSVTPEMKMLIKTHPDIISDIAHLYVIDEKKYEDVCKYTFVGKQWKCSLADVEVEIMKIIRSKYMLENMKIFIGRGKNTIWNENDIENLQSYVIIARKIMYSFDLFIEFLRANLV